MKLGISIYPGLDTDKENGLQLLKSLDTNGYLHPCIYQKAIHPLCEVMPFTFLPARKTWAWKSLPMFHLKPGNFSVSLN